MEQHPSLPAPDAVVARPAILDATLEVAVHHTEWVGAADRRRKNSVRQIVAQPNQVVPVLVQVGS